MRYLGRPLEFFHPVFEVGCRLASSIGFTEKVRPGIKFIAGFCQKFQKCEKFPPKFSGHPPQNFLRWFDAECLRESRKSNRVKIGRRMAEIWSRRRFSAKTKKTRKIDLLPPVTFFPYGLGGCRLARLRDPRGRTFPPKANLLPRKMTRLGAQKCDFCHFCNFGGSPKIYPRSDRPRFTASDFFRRAESNCENRMSVSFQIRVHYSCQGSVSCSMSNPELGRVRK